MRKKLHPLSGSIYEDIGDGLVRVTKGDQSGIFRWNGVYVEGEITSADPHMLVWVGGRELPEGQNVYQRRMGVYEVVHD